MKYIGLDAGSVSVKLVVLDDEGTVCSSLYRRHKGLPLPVALEMLKTVPPCIPPRGKGGMRGYRL